MASKVDFIRNGKELRDIRESLIAKYKHQKFTIHAKADQKNVYKTNTKSDEKYEEKSNNFGDKQQQKSSMFSDVECMKSLMNIKNTALEKELIAMEKQLVAKKSVSRKCHGKGCKETAPNHYPENVYLCGKHRQILSNKLNCDIPCDKGSAEEKQECRELKSKYQTLRRSITTDSIVTDKKHLYPADYFTVAMAKLVFCQQQLRQVDTTKSNVKFQQSTRQLKTIVDKLMDLLIAARQNLNDFWDDVFRFILNIIAQLGITVTGLGIAWIGFNAWIVSHAFYIFGLYTCIVVMSGAILYFIIYGDRGEKKAAACGAIGMGVGALFGGPGGALIGGAIGGGIGYLIYG